MAKTADIISRMRASPAEIRFADLAMVCDAAFGPPRQSGTSHRVYRTPWPGDQRVNIQCGPGGKAKACQVRQVLAALDKLASLDRGGRDDES